MGKTLTCDICKRPTEKFVGKLKFIPTAKNGKRTTTHSDYTHHADVGECCGAKILGVFGFRERMTRKEYLESRK